MSNNFDFKTKKSLGQNFLEDEFTIEEIVRVSGTSKEDTVVEIGPGLGYLTEKLAEKAKRVIAVEIDDRLIPILRAKFLTLGNVVIVHEDILKFDWSTAVTTYRPTEFCGAVEETQGRDVNCDFGAENSTTAEAQREDAKPLRRDGSVATAELRIIGNLPYYITTPILLGILEKRIPAKSITVMVQDEVADKIISGPGGREYGVLALSLQYYGNCEKVLDVPKQLFKPVPKVDSAVVNIELKKDRGLDEEGEKIYFALIKKAFSQRRKTLLNSLDGFRGLDKEKLSNILSKLSISTLERPEKLSVEQYIALSKEIENA